MTEATENESSPQDWSGEEVKDRKGVLRPADDWNPAYLSDVRFYRCILAFLGPTALMSAVGIIVIVMSSKDVPNGLVALGSASIGALAGAIVRGGR